MRKKTLAGILLTGCLLVGCGNTAQTENSIGEKNTETEMQDVSETSIAENEENDEAKEDDEAIEDDGVYFLYPYRNVDFHFAVDEYDYAFYLKGFYLSGDGTSDCIYIHPIEFVWDWETERWADWGHLEDEGPIYDVRDEGDEVLCIPLTEATEIHFINWRDDPFLYESSDRYKGRECVGDPKVFLTYVQSYGNGAANYPFFMVLDEDGNVKYIIEAFLP